MARPNDSGIDGTRMLIRNAFQQALTGPKYKLGTLLTKHEFDIGSP